MTESLNIAEVVNTLVERDLVDLYGSGPWPGEPEESDVYETDWSQVLPASPVIETTPDGSAGQFMDEYLRGDL